MRKWKSANVFTRFENQVQLATKARNDGCLFPGGISGPRHRHGEHPVAWFETHSEWRCQALKLEHVTPKFLMDSKAQPTLWQSPEGFPMMPCNFLFFLWERSRNFQIEKLGKGKIRNRKWKIKFLRKIHGFLAKWRQQKTQSFIMNIYLKWFWVSRRKQDVSSTLCFWKKFLRRKRGRELWVGTFDFYLRG